MSQDSKEWITEYIGCQHHNLILTYYLYIFSMVMTRGSGSGMGGPKRPRMSDGVIKDLIYTQVTISIRQVIQNLSVSIKITMIYIINEHYSVVIKVVVVVATAAVVAA